MSHPEKKRSALRRVLSAVGWTVIAIVAIGGVIGGLGYYLFFRQAPAPTFAAPKDRTEANRQDLEYLKTGMSLDRSFSPQARAEFTKAVDELMARAAGLDDASLEMGITKAVALADNGHTSVRETTWGTQRLKHLPLRFAQFAEGLFVVKADPAFADLLGAQLLALDGQSIDSLTASLRPYVGGPDALAREFITHVLASPPALHAVGLARSPVEATLTLRLPDGSSTERVIAARQYENVPDNTFRWPKRALSPVPVPGDTGQWVHVLDGQDLPPYLQNPNRRYWHIHMSDQLVYIQINRLLSEGDTPFDVYLAKLLTEIRERHPRYVVVDVRFSPGGNYQLAADFTKGLPDALPADGRIFILTSGNTFSAALISAARLRYFGSARVSIVGEPLGDREAFWAEGSKIRLPNSGITVGYSTGYHDWEHGCHNLLNCFWPNLFLDVAAGKLTPDIAAPLRFSDYLAGRDSAIVAIEGVIRP